MLSLFVLMSLNACNTIKGTATGAGRDIKAIWHYGSCTWDWDKDCQIAFISLPAPVAVPLIVLHAFKDINTNKLNINIIFRITIYTISSTH
jgi:predicted small secreted protein